MIHQLEAFKDINKIHCPKPGAKKGFVFGYLKQPPEMKQGDDGKPIVTVSYFFGEWSEYCYEKAK